MTPPFDGQAISLKATQATEQDDQLAQCDDCHDPIHPDNTYGPLGTGISRCEDCARARRNRRF